MNEKKGEERSLREKQENNDKMRRKLTHKGKYGGGHAHLKIVSNPSLDNPYRQKPQTHKQSQVWRWLCPPKIGGGD